MIKIEGLEHAKCNYANGESVDLKNKKYIIIDADEGYSFKGDFYIHMIDDDEEEYVYKYDKGGVNDSRLFYQIPYDATYVIKDIKTTYIEPSKPAIGPKLNLIHGFYNCSCNYENGAELVKGKPLIFTANEGYIFNEDISCTDSSDGSDSGMIYRSADNKTLSLPVDDYISSKTDITINESISAIKAISQLNTFANVYKLSDDELYRFSNEYLKVCDKDINAEQFVKKLYKFPLKIDSINLDDKDNIKLGVQNYNTKATIVNKYQISFDLGNIEVKEKYHNVYDYLNTHCILHLPFFPSIHLDAEYVVNQKIHIEFIVDMYTGICNALISSSFLQGNVFYESQGNIVQNMPIINRYNDNMVTDLDTRFLIDLKKAYIEIKRNIPYSVTNDFGKPSLEITTLADKKGYLKVEDIQLETDATIDEKEDIIKNLKNGITIL